MHEETLWVKGLRWITWMVLGVGVVGGFSRAWTAARTVNPWSGETEFAFFTFLLILAFSLVGTFIVAATIMVFLDIAADVSASRQMNAEMLKLMEKRLVAASAAGVKCTHCNKEYDITYNSCPHCGNREQKPTLTSVAAKSFASPGDSWVCSGCEERNPSSSRTCKGCGNYK
jgi:hypothetical protein